jgi:hypothetical protein
MGRHRCDWSCRKHEEDGEEGVRETLCSPCYSWQSLEDTRAQCVCVYVCVVVGSKERCPKSWPSQSPQAALLSVAVGLPGGSRQRNNQNLDIEVPIFRWFLCLALTYLEERIGEMPFRHYPNPVCTHFHSQRSRTSCLHWSPFANHVLSPHSTAINGHSLPACNWSCKRTLSGPYLTISIHSFTWL